MTTIIVIPGDCREVLRTMPSDSFDCVVTSPPYWGLRDYNVDGQIGLEPTMQGYLETMVGICRELRRVLKPTGTFWLNIGDSYAGSWGNQGRKKERGTQRAINGPMMQSFDGYPDGGANTGSLSKTGLKNKDLCMIPNRLAILLQEDGWFVRSEIIWHKPNPMPESVRDRPTCAHEKVWLLTKSAKYFYDADAIREPRTSDEDGVTFRGDCYVGGNKDNSSLGARKTVGNRRVNIESGRNCRNVWSVSPKPFKGAHFATMPPGIVERCIRAGCPEGGHVLDPFGGSGTTGDVAKRLGRNATLIELNRAYCDMTTKRLGIPSVTADDPDWPF